MLVAEQHIFKCRENHDHILFQKKKKSIETHIIIIIYFYSVSGIVSIEVAMNMFMIPKITERSTGIINE